MWTGKVWYVYEMKKYEVRVYDLYIRKRESVVCVCICTYVYTCVEEVCVYDLYIRDRECVCVFTYLCTYVSTGKV